MRPRRAATLVALRSVRLAGALVAAAACGDGGTGTERTGEIAVEVSTQGDDTPQDLYQVRVDDGTASVLFNGRVNFRALAPGTHLVELTGIPWNCDVAPGPSRTVSLADGESLVVQFVVTCYPTGIELTIEPEGIDLDTEYQVMLNGAPAGLIGSLWGRITRLAPGPYQVALGDVASNCTVDVPVGSPRAVTIVGREVVAVRVKARCLSKNGVVLVGVTTTGSDPDVDGYRAILNGIAAAKMGRHSVVGFPSSGGGEQQARLDGVARNCRVEGGDRRVASVAIGLPVRDTVRVDFEVTCDRVWRFAFGRLDGVSGASADGAIVDAFAKGDGPDWSPDGRYLAHRCLGSICLIDFQGGSTTLPFAWDMISAPAWRPDGSAVAYAAFSGGFYYYYYGELFFAGLHVASTTGPQETTIEIPSVTSADAPAWAPDGRRLVFECVPLDDQTPDLCSVEVDGSGFRRLTADSALDRHPHWSPDGSRIVFATNRFSRSNLELATMKPDGSDVVRLGGGIPGEHPAWSPDGQRIAYSREGTLTVAGIYLVNPDGTGITRLTTGADARPRWRP